MTNITISNGSLTIGTKTYNANNYSAHAEGTRVVIVHRNDDKNRLEEYAVNAVKLNGTAYNTAALFCVAFNALAADKEAGDIGSMKADIGLIKTGTGLMKENTDYTNKKISVVLTPNEATQITDKQLPGYATIKAPGTNTGLIYIGESDVDDECFALEAGQSVPVEDIDMSTVYVKNSVADEKVHVLGGYKE
jgi:hypothetical protein